MMQMDILQELYETVESRRQEKTEGSYTCYLFEQGLDKILKKCGEECSEVIIAAKNGKQEDTRSINAFNHTERTACGRSAAE